MTERTNWWTVFLAFTAGVVTGATVTSIVNRHRRKRLIISKQSAGPLLQGTGDGQSLFEPLTRSYVSISDRRADFGNVPATEDEVKAFLARRRLLQARGVKSLSTLPPPGGFGAGVALGDPLLHFQDYTAMYYYLVAPPTIGPQPKADLLYMTSSNTASKGCEALLSFFNTEGFNCVFRIWDWAHPDVSGGGKFVRGRPYAGLANYLIPYSFTLTSGTVLDTACVYIVNATRRINGNSFQNDVYLHNNASGTRDLIWSYAFDWPDKNAASPFWWGPIFETFPQPGSPQYTLRNPVGFDAALIVQDDFQFQLTESNSTLTTPSGNGLRVIYRSLGANSGLVCM
jgi:hypothetical protein